MMATTATAQYEFSDTTSISTTQSTSPEDEIEQVIDPEVENEARLKHVQKRLIALKDEFQQGLDRLNKRHPFYRVNLLADRPRGIRELRKGLKEAVKYLSNPLDLAVEARARAPGEFYTPFLARGRCRVYTRLTTFTDTEGLAELLHGRWIYISTEITWPIKPGWGIASAPVSYSNLAADVRHCLKELKIDLAKAKEGIVRVIGVRTSI